MIYKTYPNGFRVRGEVLDYCRSVAVGLWVKTGSLYETVRENGISHFIEHMVFKGTEKRSALEIAEAMDGVGGGLNAFTARDLTCFYARVTDEHLDLALDVLFDLVDHCTLDPAEMEKEKRVVMEEIAMVEDTPDELVMDMLHEAFYREHPLSRTILGPEERVASFTPEDLRSYMGRFYGPQNRVLSIAGHFDPDRLEELLRPYVEDLPVGEKQDHEPAPEKTGGYRVLSKPVEQAQLVLAWPAPPQRTPGYYALLILNNLLGGTMSSRLFQKIREEHALAYTVGSMPVGYAFTGMFCVYAGLQSENLKACLDLIDGEMRALRNGEFADAQFDKAREQLKGSYVLGLESVGQRMTALGQSELIFGEPLSEETFMKAMDAVTREDVEKIAREVLFSDGAAIAILGPGTEEEYETAAKAWLAEQGKA